MFGFGTVKVAGGSMLPTYQDGDWLVVRWHERSEILPTAIKPGSVIVVERDERPGIFLIKRLQKAHGATYWVEGDSVESTDSRSWGWIPSHEIRGRVIFRLARKRLNQ